MLSMCSTWKLIRRVWNSCKDKPAVRAMRLEFVPGNNRQKSCFFYCALVAIVLKRTIPIARVRIVHCIMKILSRVRSTHIFAIGVILCAASILPARANFHLWSVSELYSDASGSLQFIELVDNVGFQEFVGGQTLSVIGATTHSFTFGANLPGNSFGHTMLLGTAGLQAAGGPAPDYIIPNGFLFTSGGTLSFFNASGAYGALPTDGTQSYLWSGGTAVNSPMNFAGQTGTVVVPEPASISLLIGGLALSRMVRAPAKSHFRKKSR